MQTKINKKDRVIIESLVEQYGAQQLLETLNWKKLAKYAVATGIALGIPGTPAKKVPLDKYTSNVPVKKNPYGMTNADYKIFKEKVKETERLIANVLSKKGKSLNDVKFDIRNAVYQCYKHNYDLPLMLAQMQVESHFGTTPRAVETGSVCSVGLHDDKTVVTYKNQNASIEHYIKTMLRDYLDDGKKSVDRLLRDGNFVNYDGKRYASNPQYEHDIRVTRNSIMSKYPALTQDYKTYNA